METEAHEICWPGQKKESKFLGNLHRWAAAKEMCHITLTNNSYPWKFSQTTERAPVDGHHIFLRLYSFFLYLRQASSNEAAMRRTTSSKTKKKFTRRRKTNIVIIVIIVEEQRRRDGKAWMAARTRHDPDENLHITKETFAVYQREIIKDTRKLMWKTENDKLFFDVENQAALRARISWRKVCIFEIKLSYLKIDSVLGKWK